MFLGSIPTDLRKIISEYVKDWQCSDVYVGCSGNLTVERVLASHGRFNEKLKKMGKSPKKITAALIASELR